MYQIQIEPAFKADYKRAAAAYPQIKKELKAAIDELIENGAVSEERRPRELTSPGGNYSGRIGFRLSDGKVDVLVLRMPHKANPIIRLVRMGGREGLFAGPAF